MIRAPKLVISRPMYAFNPATWRERPGLGWFTVDAVWFKRKRRGGWSGDMVTIACMGTYEPHVMRYDERPTDGRYESWVAAADDNRYGGNHLSSWDGRALLTTDPPRVSPELAAERAAFLTRVLDGYPDPPAGYDGWYTFPKETR